MPKKVLIVDDEPHLLAVTKLRLEISGYEVLEADSGEKAIEILNGAEPDLILLDLRLPDMQGDAFCKRLKSDARLKKTPVILFTARSSDIPELVSETGADDYIIKPFRSEELLSKIRRFIG